MNINAEPAVPKLEPPEWLHNAVVWTAFIGLLITASGLLRVGSLVLALGATGVLLWPPKGFGFRSMGVMLLATILAMWIGRDIERRDLVRVAYAAHRAEIGCSKVDAYQSNPQDNAQPEPDDMRRCFADLDDTSMEWRDFKYELSKHGWSISD